MRNDVGFEMPIAEHEQPDQQAEDDRPEGGSDPVVDAGRAQVHGAILSGRGEGTAHHDHRRLRDEAEPRVHGAHGKRSPRRCTWRALGSRSASAAARLIALQRGRDRRVARQERLTPVSWFSRPAGLRRAPAALAGRRPRRRRASRAAEARVGPASEVSNSPDRDHVPCALRPGAAAQGERLRRDVGGHAAGRHRRPAARPARRDPRESGPARDYVAGWHGTERPGMVVKAPTSREIRPRPVALSSTESTDLPLRRRACRPDSASTYSRSVLGASSNLKGRCSTVQEGGGTKSAQFASRLSDIAQLDRTSRLSRDRQVRA